MSRNPITSTLLLPRQMSTATLIGAVHYAVALENERGRSWQVNFHREGMRDGSVLLGQNSCQQLAKMRVQPQGALSFHRSKSYSIIEVVSQAGWGAVPCLCNPQHVRINPGRTLDDLVRSLERVLRV